MDKPRKITVKQWMRKPDTDLRGYARDPKQVLGCFQRGAELTLQRDGLPCHLPVPVAVEVRISGERGIGVLSWGRQWFVAVPAEMVKALKRLGLTRHDSGNTETGECHYIYEDVSVQPCEAGVIMRSLLSGATIVEGKKSSLPAVTLFEQSRPEVDDQALDQVGHMIFGIKKEQMVRCHYCQITSYFVRDLLELQLVRERWVDAETQTRGYTADFALPDMAGAGLGETELVAS